MLVGLGFCFYKKQKTTKYQQLFVKLLLSITAMATCFIGQAQISGTVTDNLNKPVESVFVYTSSAEDVHQHTLSNGKFDIKKINIGDTVYFKHLSFEKQNYVYAGPKSGIQIKLSSSTFNLSEFEVAPQKNALSVINSADIQQNNLNSSQEILRTVPGLFIGQHAGGGKAEQLFFRGYDVDHGTDVEINADGIPVNMVSHAHGQGYADLHYIIPELINTVDFSKGPYGAEQGNFGTAATVNIGTKERLENNTLSLSGGQFNSNRLFAAVKLLDSDKFSAYVAIETQGTDGPFEVSQNFTRNNFQANFLINSSPSNKTRVLATYFNSRWDASGQVPQRAIDSGQITRFGAIDSTEGGSTSRFNLSVQNEQSVGDNLDLISTAYFSTYTFDLYSNFTFFLEDPIFGDQIWQSEKRQIFGAKSKLRKQGELFGERLVQNFGVGVRSDVANDIRLSNTIQRYTIQDNIQLGDVYEQNVFAFTDASLMLDKWILTAGLRADYFNFSYEDQLSPTYSFRSENALLLNPKVSVAYLVNDNTKLYAKSGTGIHSNDSRLIINSAVDKQVPRVTGIDLGVESKLGKSTYFDFTLWYLGSEQEFVYVGDAGIVEASDPSRRQGVELALRQQFTPKFYFKADVNYTIARIVDFPSDENFIPLAPDLTILGGLQYKNNGFGAGINVRHLGTRPANEDNSIEAIGYTVSDIYAQYTYKKATFRVDVNNVFDVDWNETQFATESRLQNEPAPVEEIHFTPGTPFFAKATLSFNF